MHLNAFVLFFLVIEITTVSSAESPQVSCESTTISDWSSYDSSHDSLQTCWIKTLKIDSKNFVLGNERDETIKALTFYDNKKVQFLPTNVANTFPSLRIFSATSCSVREISKETFFGLSKLEFLLLSSNQINTVHSGTFEGLSSLRRIELRKFFLI
jgi:hypothetical protein